MVWDNQSKIPSPFFPKLLLFRKPSNTQGKQIRFLKRTMVEKKGESTPRTKKETPKRNFAFLGKGCPPILGMSLWCPKIWAAFGWSAPFQQPRTPSKPINPVGFCGLQGKPKENQSHVGGSKLKERRLHTPQHPPPTTAFWTVEDLGHAKNRKALGGWLLGLAILTCPK